MPRQASVCKGCRAKMIWCRTGAGKKMPVDFEPHPLGNVLIPEPQSPQWDDAHAVTAIVLAGQALVEQRSSGAVLRKAHHASCPQADEFRKRPR